METPPSNLHKTIHLNINQGLNGSWNLIWNHYEGFSFGSYRIYRGTKSGKLQLLTQIQSTLNSYTDLNPPVNDTVYYQIEVVSPHPCYPDSVYSKAQTNYNTSRSNTAHATIDGFARASNNGLSLMVMPNPNKGRFNLEIMSQHPTREDYHLEIFNTVGTRVYQEALPASARISKTIHLETLSKGMYIIKLTNDKGILVTRFIIQ